jgi:regulator of sirC expression with transglutaminase-like and TPR domain
VDQARGDTVEFARQVRLPDQQLELARAALGIAAAFNPALDIEAYVHELDLMYEALANRAASSSEPAGVLQSLIRYLFEELRFRGNKADYEDPRNSYLNEVIERRLGIPITLSVVFLELGRRAGLELDGVGYPGHFLVRWTDAIGHAIFLDPFDLGRTVPEEALLESLAAGGMAAERSQSLIAAVTKRQILTRMLHNLKAVFAGRGRHDDALLASDLVLIMSPWDLDERRDHGLIAQAAGQPQLAIADLEAYLNFRADARDAPRVERQLEQIRSESSDG